MDDCVDVEKKNLGNSRCNALPELPKGMITVPDTFEATPEQAADIDFWQDLLKAPKASRGYFWPLFASFENISTPAVYEDTVLSYQPVKDGDYRFRFGISKNLCFHKAAYTHRAQGGRVIIWDKKNQLIGMEKANGNFTGFSMQLLHTEKLLWSDGAVSTKTPIVVALQDNRELDKSGSIQQADFIAELNRLTDVTLALVGASGGANSLVFDVYQSCDETPVSGLVLADIIFTKADGTAQTTPATSLVENVNVPGRYTLSKVAGTAWTAGLLNLVASNNLSIDAYESEGAIAVAIV